MEKKRIAVLAFIFTLIAPLLLFCQTTPQITTTATTATMVLPTSDLTINNIKVFRDTVIFEENFDKFVSDKSITVGNTSDLVPIPASLTKYSGCKAQKISINPNDIIYFNGAFETPELDIPNDSHLRLFVRAKSSKQQFKINDNDILESSKNNPIDVYCTIENGTNKIKVEALTTGGRVDTIRITAPIEYLPQSDYAIENGNLIINNLFPNTKYYIELSSSQDNSSEIYSFETKKKIANLSSQIVNTQSVNLSWENNDNSAEKTLHLYRAENAINDLLIYRIVTYTSNFGLGIYNGTTKDICLGDYEIIFAEKGMSFSTVTIKYCFSEMDTIHSNSEAMLFYSFSTLGEYDNTCFPIRSSNALAGGNDAYVLLKKDISGSYNDTIDLFGRLVGNDSGNGMSYARRILTRSSEVVNGVKNNPISADNSFPGWNVVEYEGEQFDFVTTQRSRTYPLTYSEEYRTFPLEATANAYQLTDLDANSQYRAVIMEGEDTLAMVGFSTGKVVQTSASGYWNATATWEGEDNIPQYCDKVIVQKGHKLTIPSGTSASCAELVLQSDYSVEDYNTQKAELDLQGVLTVGKTTVEASFKGYTAATNGWHFFGVPIDVTSASRSEIGAMFNRGNADDLYYLNEEMYAWIPYVEDFEEENFFTNRHGYLVAYEDDKTLSFSGDLFLDNSITLLNNASYTSGINKGNGYHLVCNPYPFSISLNHFERANIDGFWLLNPTTGSYIPSDNNEAAIQTIPPFGGFMTKVSSATNSLVLHKEPQTQNTSKSSQSVQSVKFNLSYEGGNDQMRIYFRKEAGVEYDDYDTYKMFSLGTAPDLSCRFNDMDLSIVSLPDSIDSVRLQVEVMNKTAADLTLQMYEMTEDFEEVKLYVQGSDSLICDFKKDSLCLLPLTLEKKKITLDLVLTKRRFVETNQPIDKVVYSQDKREIEVLYPQDVDELILTDMQGREVEKAFGNTVSIPSSGCFILKAKSGSSYYSTKVMGL